MATWNTCRLAAACGFISLTVVGCGSSPTAPTPAASPTPAPSTTFTGTIAGSSGQSGTLVITIATAVTSSAHSEVHSVANATATLTLINGGGTFALAGTFDDATKSLTLSGSGFSLNGSIAGGQVTGHYTGPDGSVGLFSNLNSTTQSVQPYCGTYHRTTEDGVWNFQIAASGAISGDGIATSGPSSLGASEFFITGTRTGNTVDFTVHTNDGVTQVTGTIQGTSVGGSFIDNHGWPGDFSGRTCTGA